MRVTTRSAQDKLYAAASGADKAHIVFAQSLPERLTAGDDVLFYVQSRDIRLYAARLQVRFEYEIEIRFAAAVIDDA